MDRDREREKWLEEPAFPTRARHRLDGCSCEGGGSPVTGKRTELRGMAGDGGGGSGSRRPWDGLAALLWC